jgi:hypothetical protein
MSVRGPDDSSRVLVVGSTGSGKSQFAIAMLSTRNWGQGGIPWFILDYKGEDLIEEILAETGSDGHFNDGPIKRVSVYSDPPKQPGLYYVKLRPHVDDIAIELFLQKIYDRASNGRRRIGSGIFLDEGYALPRNCKFFDVLLTQGRTLKCPIICLYQRPVHMSRFAVTQASFIAMFRVQDLQDKKRLSEYTAPAIGVNNEPITPFSVLPSYHCLWYDVSRGSSTVLAPAPSREEIIHRFKSRLAPRKKRAFI